MLAFRIDPKSWEARKNEFLQRIERDREIGYLDEGIEETLNLINRRKKSYTTSSCTGRIVVIDTDFPWIRDDSVPILKSHKIISKEQLQRVLKLRPAHSYWYIVSGPILHINTLDLEEASEILRIARNAGFKHSGIISISETGITIEIISGSQMAFPIKIKDVLLLNEEGVDIIIKISEEILSEGRKKLNKLNELLRSDEK